MYNGFFLSKRYMFSFTSVLFALFFEIMTDESELCSLQTMVKVYTKAIANYKDQAVKSHDIEKVTP